MNNGANRDTTELVVEVRITDDVLADNPEYHPAYATPGAAALDLRACLEEAVVLHPGATLLVDAGFSIHLKDPGLCGVIMPRSGLGKKGVVLANTVGLIDSDYQGNIQVVLWNRSTVSHLIMPYERVAQLALMPVVRPRLKLVDAFGEVTERGAGGFGSTGKM